MKVCVCMCVFVKVTQHSGLYVYVCVCKCVFVKVYLCMCVFVKVTQHEQYHAPDRWPHFRESCKIKILIWPLPQKLNSHKEIYAFTIYLYSI